MSELRFEIAKKVGAISQSPRGWEKQLNVISWNERAPKYDLRDWSPDGAKMGKGLTLSIEELKALKRLLNHMDELND
ncbi:MAG: PC4/YdbC family ssDNA-binding protein [Sporolactobacillus sp.]